LDSAIGGGLVPSLLVRSGSNWVPEKGIYVMQGGSWQRKMGYVYVNGQWVPLSSGIIYMEGYEAVPLIATRNSEVRVICEKRSDHLYIWVVGSLFEGGRGRFRTADPIDLTPFTQIRVLWRSGGDQTVWNDSRLLVMDPASGVVVREFSPEEIVFDWREDVLDISDLTGSYYVFVQKYISGNNRQGYLWVRQIYLV